MNEPVVVGVQQKISSHHQLRLGHQLWAGSEPRSSSNVYNMGKKMRPSEPDIVRMPIRVPGPRADGSLAPDCGDEVENKCEPCGLVPRMVEKEETTSVCTMGEPNDSTSTEPHTNCGQGRVLAHVALRYNAMRS